jgi:methylmalonyl-CoA mutase
MLKEESYLDKVVDPSSGSYYIEYLTDQLVQHAWGLFKEIESQGGFIASFKNGKIQNRIGEVRRNREKLTSQRRQIFVGTNQYPNIKETLDTDKISVESISSESEFEVLMPQRGAQVIEEIRLDTERFVKSNGTRPKVYICLIGDNPTMRTARATFSTGFLGCGGFEIIDGPIEPETDKAIQLAIDSDADVTVLCGSDEDYANSGTELAKKYKEAKPDSYLVLAGYPIDIIEPLTEAGIDLFIHLKANLVDSLKAIQKKLQIIK